MGVFGNIPPTARNDDKALPGKLALLAALKMREAYVALRDEWKREAPEFAQTGMGIGISTGKVKTGTVGPEATMVGPGRQHVQQVEQISHQRAHRKRSLCGRPHPAAYRRVLSHGTRGYGLPPKRR